MDLFITAASASASASGVLSGADANNPPKKIRSACNRCHSQKLKCVRKMGQVSCDRCLKLKTSCRFGPRAPRASLKPRERATGCPQGDWHEPVCESASTPTPNIHSNAMIASDSDWLFPLNAEMGTDEDRATIHPDLCYHTQGNGSNMQNMDWPGIFCESRNAIPMELEGPADLDLIANNEYMTSRASSLASPGVSDSYLRIGNHDTNDSSETCPTSTVRRLASLNVAIYECTAQLPFMSEAGVSADVRGSRKATLFAIDEVFRLTTEFINVMKCLSIGDCDTLSPMDPKKSVAQSALSLVAYSQQLSPAGQPVTSTAMRQPSGPFSHADEATMFMVVSCHCRLVEIYGSIFKMMHACIKYSLAPRIGKDWVIILPHLQVGSLTSPPVHVDVNTPVSPATSSMYMLMITLLSSQLWGQLAGLVRTRADVPEGSRSSPQCALVDTMWDTVTGRTDHLLQTIDATRHLLQR